MRQFDPCYQCVSLPLSFAEAKLHLQLTTFTLVVAQTYPLHVVQFRASEIPPLPRDQKLPLQNAPFRGKRASETPTFLIFLLLETIGSKYAGRWESSVVLVQSVIQEVCQNSVAIVYPTNIRKSHTYISDNMGKYRAEVLSSSSTIIIINIFVFSLARVRAAAAAYMGYLWKQTVQA
jgi:hypothetical protein